MSADAPTASDWLANPPAMLRSYGDRIASGTVVLPQAEQARVVYLLADLLARIDYLERLCGRSLT